jgi:hypothetical protein
LEAWLMGLAVKLIDHTWDGIGFVDGKVGWVA